jgi:hypothetical protein
MLLHNCSDPLFVSDKSMTWNRCPQHPCFKNLCKIAQASKNSDSNAQHFLSDLPTHSWFHSMLFALAGYQFPYIVMNRCLYLTLWINSSSTHNREQFTCSFLDLTNHIWYKTENWICTAQTCAHVCRKSHYINNYAAKPNEENIYKYSVLFKLPKISIETGLEISTKVVISYVTNKTNKNTHVKNHEILTW